PPAPSRRRSGAASRPAPSSRGRCRRSRSRALSRSVALLARVLRDRGARLLDQRGPVDALLLDLAHPALDDRLELLAERGELLVGQDDVLVARLRRERDAGIVRCLPDLADLAQPVLARVVREGLLHV